VKLFRNILTGLLAAVFAVSSLLALDLALDYRAEQERHADALALASGTGPHDPPPLPEITEPAPLPANILLPQTPPATEPEPAEPLPTEPTGPAPIFDLHAPWLEDLDLEALREVNADVVGWILIPGTRISYPIVQGADNDYYLNHTWDGQQNAAGAVFLEASHAADFSDFSTILYGHNLRSGAMFTDLHRYKAQDFWQDHPFVYIATDTGCSRYRIYAAYEADVTGPTYWQSVPAELQREYVDYGLTHSTVETGVIPDDGAPVLTLSTCTGYTYARRWVVQAVLEGPITGAPAIIPFGNQ